MIFLVVKMVENFWVNEWTKEMSHVQIEELCVSLTSWIILTNINYWLRTQEICYFFLSFSLFLLFFWKLFYWDRLFNQTISLTKVLLCTMFLIKLNCWVMTKIPILYFLLLQSFWIFSLFFFFSFIFLPMHFFQYIRMVVCKHSLHDTLKKNISTATKKRNPVVPQKQFPCQF